MMTKLMIEIETTNDAFADGGAPEELARILHVLAANLLARKVPENLKDINGNSVGKVAYEKE